MKRLIGIILTVFSLVGCNNRNHNLPKELMVRIPLKSAQVNFSDNGEIYLQTRFWKEFNLPEGVQLAWWNFNDDRWSPSKVNVKVDSSIKDEIFAEFHYVQDDRYSNFYNIPDKELYKLTILVPDQRIAQTWKKLLLSSKRPKKIVIPVMASD